MYHQKPQLETKLEVLDELADVRMTLDGLSSLTLSLSNSNMNEPEAIKLVACLLNYCALSTSEISKTIEGRRLL